MRGHREHLASLLAILFGLSAAAPARAASLQPVSNWGASGVPTYISMYIYVPDKPATSPPILVVSHFCGGSASQVFGQAQTGGIVAAADKYGFIMIFPQTTNAASSAKCWDVGSTQSLTHDGGGDTQAVAQMVKYTIATYQANADRVYATGDSSGGMMTEALLAVYPDIFKAGAAFAGVPAGCWSLGWSSASNWGATCAGSGNPAVSSVNQTAQQWGDKVRAMYPGYAGHRPRAQLFHGDKDQYIAFTNLREGVKEWTNVLGLSTEPTSTETGLTLGTHQATRQRWKNSCGQVVLEAIASLGGDHGPSDALFSSSYVIPFLGLDQTDAVDPEVAQCGAGGAAGSGGATGGAGAPSTGGSKATGGASFSTGGTRSSTSTLNAGGKSSGGTPNTSGVTPTGGTTNAGEGGAGGSSSNASGTKSSGGSPSTGSSVLTASGGSATGGMTGSGGSTGNSSPGSTAVNGDSGAAMGGASHGTSNSLSNGQGGAGTGTNSATPEDTGACNCHMVGNKTSGRGTLSALLLAACAAALRARRKERWLW
ncbi:MAG TPA: PHB depolymerase family esterase [Polyangiaceae bacterium]